MAAQGLHIELDERQKRVRITGPLNLKHFQQANDALAKVYDEAQGPIVVDLSAVSHLDTAGAMLLHPGHGKSHLALEHVKPEHKALFELVSQAKPGAPPKEKDPAPFRSAVIRLGKATLGLRESAREFITSLGQACATLAKILRHPKHLRLRSITHHIEAIGIDAIPIIALIALVISIVLAYQGQAQLRPLGVQVYTVNLIAISVLREMGVLLTAIMVAGRTGSAFAAEIGTMKLREEVDALRTIGFKPFELLVLPRLIALVIALPLLTLLADLTGLFGGAVLSMSLLGISLPEYLERVRQAATWKDFLVGEIKAPVFAFIIALVGCRHGFKVSGSAESVGKETTAAVVESIFLVLLLDGLFSIYFQKVGL